jgi:hypothetical protein
MKTVLVTVRCSECRRPMALVGRDPATPPGFLELEFAGREPDPNFHWTDRVRWKGADKAETIRDPRRPIGTGEPAYPLTPLMCDKHPKGRPFLRHLELADVLTLAEARGKTEDFTVTVAQ